MNFSLKRFALFSLTLVGALQLSSAVAQPIQLSEPEYQQQTQGLHKIVENFDAMPIGTPASPLQLANGRFFGQPQIIDFAWCLFSPCLAVGLTTEAEFADFPAGTRFWSGRMIHASDGNVVDVTVVGQGGTQVFRLPTGSFVPNGIFVGFHDPQGLQSIRFELVVAAVNYSFDDVETATILFRDGFEGGAD
jgi:hypothetical protein